MNDLNTREFLDSTAFKLHQATLLVDRIADDYLQRGTASATPLSRAADARHDGPTSQQAIAASLDVSRASITQRVSALVETACSRSRTRDSRANRRLTTAGREPLDAAWQGLETHQTGLDDGVDEAVLVAQLDRLIATRSASWAAHDESSSSARAPAHPVAARRQRRRMDVGPQFEAFPDYGCSFPTCRVRREQRRALGIHRRQPADQLRSFLPIGHPRYVVGLSLGSSVALELAARHPQLVRRLVLASPTVVPATRRQRMAARVQLAFWHQPAYWSATARAWGLPDEDRELFVRTGLGIRRETAERCREVVAGIPPALLERIAFRPWRSRGTGTRARYRATRSS